MSPFPGSTLGGPLRRWLFAVAALAAFAGQPVLARPAPDSFADLAEKLSPAVVNISTSQRVSGSRGIPTPAVPDGSPFQEFFDDFFDRNGGEGGGGRKVQSLGSGFVIDPTGIIVTNNHVISEADEIFAVFSDGTKLKAELLGKDTKTDLAVLQVKPTHPLVAVKLGDSNKLRVGDWVLAIGNPFGFGGTVTAGIVSALNRDINSGPYDKFIQTDASINRGNSGGPLFDMNGDVIGVNTAIISPTGGSIGIGFAVPSEIALPVIQQLREFGETRRGWIGVRIQEVTDEVAASLRMPKAQGALIGGVTAGGPAAQGGLEAGDVVVEFDGREVPGMRDLPRMVADTAIDKVVAVVVIRKGDRKTLSIKLGRLEESEQAALSGPSGDGGAGDAPTTGPESASPVTDLLGLTLAELTPERRTEFKIGTSVEGVVVTAVEADSPAAEKRLQPGDVIMEVGQSPTRSPKDVIDRVRALRQEGRRSILFLVSGKTGDLRFIAIQVDDVGSGTPPAADGAPDAQPPGNMPGVIPPPDIGPIPDQQGVPDAIIPDSPTPEAPAPQPN